METHLPKNAIDADVLRYLTDEDLKDLGVSALGDRKRRLRAFGQIDDNDATPTNNDAAIPPDERTLCSAHNFANKRIPMPALPGNNHQRRWR